MTFELYPRLIGDNVRQVVEEIIETRDDDITVFDEIIRRLNSGQVFSNQSQGGDSDLQLGSTDFHVDVDATAAGVTVTFESAPNNGQMHAVSKSDASANIVTVSGNGKNINGAATDTLNLQYLSRMYIFVGAADEWRIL